MLNKSGFFHQINTFNCALHRIARQMVLCQCLYWFTWYCAYSFGKSSTSWLHHTDQYAKEIMHQPSWSYTSSITQPFWRWSFDHKKSRRFQVSTEVSIKRSPSFCTHIQKVQFQLRVMHCPPSWQNVLSTQLQLTLYV